GVELGGHGHGTRKQPPSYPVRVSFVPVAPGDTGPHGDGSGSSRRGRLGPRPARGGGGGPARRAGAGRGGNVPAGRAGSAHHQPVSCAKTREVGGVRLFSA